MMYSRPPSMDAIRRGRGTWRPSSRHVANAVTARAASGPSRSSPTPTLPAGEAQVSASTGFTLVLANLSPNGPSPLPWIEIGGGWRRGLVEGLDVGIRGWGFGVRGVVTVGAAADLKWQWAGGDGGCWDAAVDVALSYEQVRLGGTPGHIPGVTVPLLFGRNMGPHQLVFGPRVSGQLQAAPCQRTTAQFLTCGGIALHDSTGRDWMPELIWMWSPNEYGGSTPIQMGFGMAFD